MNHQWWQNKYVWGLGLLGGVLSLLQPMLGAIVWPLYKPIKYVTAILTAADNQERTLFVNLDLLAAVLILVFLVAMREYARHEKLTGLVKFLRPVMLGYVLLQLLEWFIPLAHVADASMTPYHLSLHDLLIFFGTGVLAILFLRLGNEWQKHQQPSIANVWRLSGALMLVFVFALFIVRMLSWPFAGLFDQLTNFAMVLPVMYTSWQFMKLY
ncbi:MAG: hypothetical protein LBT37_07225 [Lactobacillaceae bacterium]|jgi:hypothetical protein|nr:hypothetical protein [Lactobacillaceae bacterium]